MKKTKGFTLVELVVVIAIIGVLAAILVPTILNYVRKARLKAANTNAKSAYNAVDEFFTSETAEKGKSLSAILAMYNGKTIDCNIPPEDDMNAALMAVHNVLANNGIYSGHVFVGSTTINENETIYVQWTGEEDADTNPESVVGQYPNPISWETYKSDHNAWRSYVAPVS